MTSVTFTKYYEKFIFECKGHAEYGPRGGDILCSAVSTLCYTLERYLSGAFERGLIINYNESFSEGYVIISFEYADTFFTTCVEEAVNAVLGGFTLLSESFPDHVSADIC